MSCFTKLFITFTMLIIASCVMMPLSVASKENYSINITSGKTVENTCDSFRFPDIKPIPALPEMTESEIEDPEKRTELLVENIRALRLHIKNERAALQKAVDEYEKSCNR